MEIQKNKIRMSEAWLYLRDEQTLGSPQTSVRASLPHKARRSHQCLSQAPLLSGPLMPAEPRLVLAAFQEE